MSETVELKPRSQDAKRERSLLSRVVRSGTLLTVSRLSSRFLALATMSIMAHQLAEHDMGVAMSLLAAVALVEMIGEFGLEQRLVQLDEHEAHSQLPTIQSVLLLRGLGATALLCLVAYPMGVAFQFGEDRLAFFTVAAVPLVRSLRNVQFFIRQRQLDFRATAAAEAAPEIAAIAAAYPCLTLFDGYQAIIAITYLRAVVAIAISFFLSATPYRLGWDRDAAAGLFTYGWPLTLNGLLLYGSMQGDRLVVASTFDMASMACYSLAASYTLIPSLAVNSLMRRLFLPLLVVDEGSAQFEQRYRVLRAVSEAAALAFFGFFLLIGPKGVALLMSDKYEGTFAVSLILALAAGFRTLRSSLVIPILAHGQTRVLLWGSLVRCLGLALAIPVAVSTLNLVLVAWCAVAGEVVAVFVSIAVVRRQLDIESCTYAREMLPFTTAAAVLAAAHFFIDTHLPASLTCGLLFVGITCFLGWRSFVMLRDDGAARSVPVFYPQGESA